MQINTISPDCVLRDLEHRLTAPMRQPLIEVDLFCDNLDQPIKGWVSQVIRDGQRCSVIVHFVGSHGHCFDADQRVSDVLAVRFIVRESGEWSGVRLGSREVVVSKWSFGTRVRYASTFARKAVQAHLTDFGDTRLW
jgi:hypothetical protein